LDSRSSATSTCPIATCLTSPPLSSNKWAHMKRITGVMNILNPIYCFHIRTSPLGSSLCLSGGSFRQFLWQVVRELQSAVLPILLPCPSGAAGVNKVNTCSFISMCPTLHIDCSSEKVLPP